MSAIDRLRQFATGSVEGGSYGLYLSMKEAAEIIAEIDRLRVVEYAKSQGISLSRIRDKEK